MKNEFRCGVFFQPQGLMSKKKFIGTISRNLIPQQLTFIKLKYFFNIKYVKKTVFFFLFFFFICFIKTFNLLQWAFRLRNSVYDNFDQITNFLYSATVPSMPRKSDFDLCEEKSIPKTESDTVTIKTCVIPYRLLSVDNLKNPTFFLSIYITVYLTATSHQDLP